MAAEIHETKTVEAPAISDSEAATKTNESHHVDADPASVNGTAASVSPDELANRHIADIVDDLVNSAEPSISGGSDTEASRPDASKHKDGDKGHVRTSSAARKPTTFKSVSVNKTFLAAKAATATAAAKPGDKASPTLGVASLQSSSSSSARPRLVAKTAGSLVAKGAGANGRPPAAPDPNAVWNKNRPPPPPEPKTYTDEELKKYGIHMARRLQADDEKHQANNWADIEDDDDDWAPEEIRWTDGTKSTIPHHDEHSEASPQPSNSQLAAQSPATSTISPAGHTQPMTLLSKESHPIQKSSSHGPAASAPISKPHGLPSGKGLVFKAASEKPTLVAKPPAPPTPVKSPWAPLPPVDKAPPVLVDMPHNMGGSRMQNHHQQHPPRNIYGGPPRGGSPPPHFKEIAADDFSRGGFRDGHPHMNRELFNSQSGMLEPVMDRRGSWRSDIHYRNQPGAALLQRSSHGSDHPEPSAAFQTHRSSMQEGPYGRRRGSSNVSGGSGSFLQRIGRPNDQHVPTELLGARQPSLTGRSDSPASPRNFSPSGSRSWQSRGSPSLSFSAPYQNAGPVPAGPVGTAGPAASTGPDGQPPVAAGAPAVQGGGGSIEEELELQKKIMRERRELAKKRRLEEEEREEAARRERIRLKLEAMGPAPERKSAKKEQAKEASKAEALSTTETATTELSAHASTSKENRPHDGDTNGPKASQAAEKDEPTSPEAKTQAQQSWQGPVPPHQSERLSSWGSANQAMSRNVNVWGAPNINNRSLGNGTFHTDLGHGSEPYTPSASQIAGKVGPGPIGPPPSQKSTAAPAIAPIGPPKTASSTTVASQAATAPAAAPAASSAPTATASSRSAWANAVKANDDNLLAQQQAHRAEQQREAESRGMTLQDLRPTIKDTWMPTRMNEDGDRVEEKAKSSVVSRPGNTTGAANGPASTTIHAQQQSRPSRFFPARHGETGPTSPGATGSSNHGSAHGSGRPGSPSPPPPDMDGHPAFDGDAAHPHVSLPRPQIVVRLPPKANAASSAASSQQHQSHPQLAASHWNQVQGPTKEEGSWQAKFDHLFDRKATSPSKPVTTTSFGHRATGSTEAQTRPTADSLWSSSTRNISPTQPHILPRTRIPKFVPQEPVTSRTMAEECFERQEMGSLPPVHLPNTAPELAWTPASAPKPLPRRFALTATTTVDHEGLIKDSFGAPYIASIRLPGQTGAAKRMNLPQQQQARTHSNPRRSNIGGRGSSGRHASSSHRGSNKTRDTASSHSGSHTNDHGGQSPSSSHLPSGRRGGGLRHRSENWTRNSSAPVQT